MADNVLHYHSTHDPTNQGMVSVPHGPETGQDHAHFTGPPENGDEKLALRQLIYPADSYTPEGTYWADLPLGQQLSFNSKIDNAEAASELRAIGQMIKKDPLSPVGWYFRHAVLPGAGLGLEGYVLFSIGNLTPLYQAAWPACWETYEICNKTWVHSVEYLEVCGIIVGQVLVGALGDGIGRRWGLIQDAVIMFVGLLMLIASWGTTLNGWVICYAWSLFFYGVGVGGEYPMTATAAMENATSSGKISTREDRLHRGRKVTMAFLMQGWGQFFNQSLLILLLLIFHHGSGNPPYSELTAQWVFRVSFAIPAVGTLWLVYYRTFKMPLASKALDTAKKLHQVKGYDYNALKLAFRFFGGRLIATTGAWYCNDVFFYGNKLFQSQFISVISPGNRSVLESWLWSLVNIGVSLCGYYLASFLIDNKTVGRKRMQQVGFIMDFILFIVPAFHYKYYALEKAHIGAFQTMYFLSSFFNQFGPNSVTFIVAAEVYPTPIRASAHGLSAACGKLGALTAAVLYNYIDTQQKFYVVPWFGLAGAVITFFFLPDTTGLDLKEQERRFKFLREGREHEYHGIAVHPHHLSLWERLRGVGKDYNPELDYQDKVVEMRTEWSLKQVQNENLEASSVDMDDDYPPEVHEYFKRSYRSNGSEEGEKVAIPSE
ncbi:putative inorganic phosphate transporter-2 [Coleophoma cylindrospora]|uniref:Putative inorganic phosphate transporter-2 n=1 Tax=Coleophoma cylindrospora TaxID=1849047 RepID=A0A3D8RLG0_9HELO|nr:putative inorganic phosphate transporter-2 [Coleophoma cylindrospora]